MGRAKPPRDRATRDAGARGGERAAGGSPRAVAVARAGELTHGETRKFVVPVGGGLAEAFVVCWHGELHAFLNRCRHVGVTLDWVEGRFLSPDGRFVHCPVHGACYAPDSGQCVAGPPFGKRLHRVPLAIENGTVMAYPLDRDPDGA